MMMMIMASYKIIFFFLTAVGHRKVSRIEEYREDGSNDFLRKVCKLLSDYTARHLR
jgi:hypothetical protein